MILAWRSCIKAKVERRQVYSETAFASTASYRSFFVVCYRAIIPLLSLTNAFAHVQKPGCVRFRVAECWQSRGYYPKRLLLFHSRGSVKKYVWDTWQKHAFFGNAVQS